MINNFNFIAPFYDSLARLVFGKSIRQAELTFLSEIEEGDQVLILGGGTGKILTALDNLNRQMQIAYIDKSAKMIELSQRRRPFKNLSVQYICGDHTQIPNKKYDVIQTAFFLDVFDHKNLSRCMFGISQVLRRDGIWLQTDFVRGGKFWQQLLLKAMYSFFKLTCGIQASKLPDFHKHFIKQGFSKQKSKSYYSKMIEASVYKRPISI